MESDGLINRKKYVAYLSSSTGELVIRPTVTSGIDTYVVKSTTPNEVETFERLWGKVYKIDRFSFREDR
jgi:hypothetical protein